MPEESDASLPRPGPAGELERERAGRSSDRRLGGRCDRERRGRRREHRCDARAWRGPDDRRSGEPWRGGERAGHLVCRRGERAGRGGDAAASGAAARGAQARWLPLSGRWRLRCPIAPSRPAPRGPGADSAVRGGRRGGRREPHRLARTRTSGSGQTVYTFVGVDLGEKGTHVLTLTGTDPFGNVRERFTAKIVRTGEIVAMKLVEADHNVADGRTPVRARIEIIDASGNVIHGAIKLDVLEGNLRAYHRKDENFTVEDLGERAPGADRPRRRGALRPGHHQRVLSRGALQRHRQREGGHLGAAEDARLGSRSASPRAPPATTCSAATSRCSRRAARTTTSTTTAAWPSTRRARSGEMAHHRGLRLDPQPEPDPEPALPAYRPASYFTLYGDSSQQDYDAASTRKI